VAADAVLRQLDAACFSDAYKQIAVQGCKHLTDVQRRHLALHFASCHMRMSGRFMPDCPISSDISSCTNKTALDDVSFGTYTAYTLHTESLCFYVETKEWEATSSDLIRRLLSGANSTAAVSVCPLLTVIDTSLTLTSYLTHGCRP
jgi:hypothetical protein